ncbi:MAG: hypothetical protein KKI02_02025 [Planctomycetes bacterium]|nr:hypothetical protein [Planctomycetota bacterium]
MPKPPRHISTLPEEASSEKNQKHTGYFGKIRDVRICGEAKYEPGNTKYRKTPVRSKFRDRELKCSFPVGWIYPIFAGFRVLVESDDAGEGTWKNDPIKFWKRHGERIVQQFHHI